MRKSPKFWMLAAGVVVAMGGPLWAIPPNGTYHTDCAGTAPAPGAAEARLSFPEVCFDGACCQLFNPTRLRDLPDQFLYDGTCEDAAGRAFEARIFFGDGPEENSLVIVLRDRAATLRACAPLSLPLEDA